MFTSIFSQGPTCLAILIGCMDFSRFLYKAEFQPFMCSFSYKGALRDVELVMDSLLLFFWFCFFQPPAVGGFVDSAGNCKNV